MKKERKGKKSKHVEKEREEKKRKEGCARVVTLLPVLLSLLPSFRPLHLLLVLLLPPWSVPLFLFSFSHGTKSRGKRSRDMSSTLREKEETGGKECKTKGYVVYPGYSAGKPPIPFFPQFSGVHTAPYCVCMCFSLSFSLDDLQPQEIGEARSAQ